MRIPVNSTVFTIVLTASSTPTCSSFSRFISSPFYAASRISISRSIRQTRSCSSTTSSTIFLQNVLSPWITSEKSPSFQSPRNRNLAVSKITGVGSWHRENLVRKMSSVSDSVATERSTVRRVALLQFIVSHEKWKNLDTAWEYMTRAVVENKAELLVLPEIWNGPYATLAFPEYAETLPDVGDQYNANDISQKDTNDRISHEMEDKSPSASLLMKFAKQYGVYVVGGSISECRIVRTQDDHEGKKTFYNTCLCIDPQGTVVAKHRKAHLFDIDVPGKIRFKESDTLTPGDGGKVTYFDTGDMFGRIGVGICYDIRFPEYALLLTQQYNCNILVYPGAFNLTTGPAHWELLQRARAVDGQCFVLTASPARADPASSPSSSSYPHYSAWGHSTIVAPWGNIVATCDEKETIVVGDLDMKKVTEMRESIPTRVQKRHDIYQLKHIHTDT